MKKILASILMSAVLAGCGKPKATGLEVPPAMPEQALEKFTVSETHFGKPNWVLDANSAQINEKDKRVLVQKPVIQFYKDGQYSSTLKSASGRINTENYDIWADGKCVLTTTKGETLTTSNLVYLSSTGKIMTDDPVTIVRADETIDGEGMEASPNLEDIVIKKQRVVMHNEK